MTSIESKQKSLEKLKQEKFSFCYFFFKMFYPEAYKGILIIIFLSCKVLKSFLRFIISKDDCDLYRSSDIMKIFSFQT